MHDMQKNDAGWHSDYQRTHQAKTSSSAQSHNAGPWSRRGHDSASHACRTSGSAHPRGCFRRFRPRAAPQPLTRTHIRITSSRCSSQQNAPALSGVAFCCDAQTHEVVGGKLQALNTPPCPPSLVATPFFSQCWPRVSQSPTAAVPPILAGQRASKSIHRRSIFPAGCNHRGFARFPNPNHPVATIPGALPRRASEPVTP